MKDILKRANEILGTNYRYWKSVSMHEGLTEDFIREFADKVDWNCISRFQYLSEDFIREFKDRVDWCSKHQHLSKEFIREFKDEVEMTGHSRNIFIRNGMKTKDMLIKIIRKGGINYESIYRS